MSLTEALYRLYDAEINVSITSFWDGGYVFAIGDQINGFVATAEAVYDLDEGAEWLLEEATRLYPEAFKMLGDD